MRVVSGTVRGKRLCVPDCATTRPTTDRIKESIFNIIQFDVPGCTFLDLFAGSGQIGIEALSRGATRAFFVDSNQACIKVITANLMNTGLQERSVVVCSEVTSYMKRCTPHSFDIIFMDPPYGGELLKKALHSLIDSELLSENGKIVCESAINDSVGELNQGYQIKKEYLYKDKKITVITKEHK